jgi:superfamily II DNA/RNA helicase
LKKPFTKAIKPNAGRKSIREAGILLPLKKRTLEFSELGLQPELLDGIAAMNFREATPIQEQSIPIILEGKDLVGIAQTGTGKTAAFVLPLLDRLLELGPAKNPQALILVPTRELAIQIDTAIEAYAYFTGASSVAVYGGGDGKDFNREKTALTGGVDVVIATPGRLIAHMNMGYVNFKEIQFLVLDEADRMLDMGFLPDLNKIIQSTNPNRQTLLFSATMPPTVFTLAKKLMKDPETVNIALSKPAEGVTQGAYIVREEQKVPLITKILKEATGKSVLVFCSTKQNVSKVYSKLKSKGLSVGKISSDLDQTEREETLKLFRNRQVDIIVATDVVSRGIDIDGIELVINFDLPRDAEDYVHRVGRTARAARKGEALTLVGEREQTGFGRIEALIGSEVNKLPVPEEFGPTPPYQPGRGGNRGGRPGGKKGSWKGKRNQRNSGSRSGGSSQGKSRHKSGNNSGKSGGNRPPKGRKPE